MPIIATLGRQSRRNPVKERSASATRHHKILAQKQTERRKKKRPPDDPLPVISGGYS